MSGHNHDHSHDHGPGHSHAPADFGKAFAIGILLNTGFVVVEAAYGVLSQSMALVADAGHNLSDVLGLLLAWFAASLSKRPPSRHFTYGLKGSSVLAALANAFLLLLAIGAIAWESILRLETPEPVGSGAMMIVATIGIVINAATAWLFARGRDRDLNIRGAYLHMVADTAVSAGVVLAGLLIWYTNALWIDPATSLVIVAVIGWSTWDLLRESLKLSVAGVPAGVDLDAVKEQLGSLGGVASLHDLHVWAIGTTDIALTAHLVMPGGHPGDHFLIGAAKDLRESHGIGHVSLQIETGEADCPLAPPDVV
ncbi:MAG: cation transporter [Alphaproteobacteria bacterium]|nr:cation transporter [Alphaproteobacteria bacterium]